MPGLQGESTAGGARGLCAGRVGEVRGAPSHDLRFFLVVLGCHPRGCTAAGGVEEVERWKFAAGSWGWSFPPGSYRFGCDRGHEAGTNSEGLHFGATCWCPECLTSPQTVCFFKIFLPWFLLRGRLAVVRPTGWFLLPL